MDLKDVIAALNGLPAAEREALAREALEATKEMVWVPNPGPQTLCYESLADETLFGGEPGGGKSQVLIGLALTSHDRSLLLRRTSKEASKFVGEIGDILGSRDCYSGKNDQWILADGKVIDHGGCQHEDDKQKYKGNPHDLIGFDELTDFTESQYMFIKMWNRSTKPGQRCRVVAASNGPSSAAGLWVVNRWAAWLDPKHPNPAQSGEIRWYIVDDDGKEVEVEGRGPYTVLGRQVEAVSRTFIHSRLDDNPDLAATNYGSQLMAQTGVNRQAYALGGFGAMLADDPWQGIPTEWVMQAIARWTPQPPMGVPMCSIGCDVAQGGTDESVLAPRHDGWFAKLETKPGKDTPTGAEVAGMVLAKRRDGCSIVIDVGGGYGADAYGHLKGNQIDNVVPYMGVKPSERRTVDNLWKFANVRTQAYWQFREALNPDQPGGSPIMLPDDRLLIADLTAPTYWVQSNVLHLESKEEVTKRMGRSTDRGDAVVMSWYAGAKAASDWNRWPASQGGRRMAPKVNLGHSAARRKK